MQNLEVHPQVQEKMYNSLHGIQAAPAKPAPKGDMEPGKQGPEAGGPSEAGGFDVGPGPADDMGGAGPTPGPQAMDDFSQMADELIAEDQDLAANIADLDKDIDDILG